MDFKIFVNRPIILTVNDKKVTFIAGKSYGFKDLNNKEAKEIRKIALKDRAIVFTETSNFTGCYKVIYGAKKVEDKVVKNLVTMNKGKKNKSLEAFKQVEKVEGKGYNGVEGEQDA